MRRTDPVGEAALLVMTSTIAGSAGSQTLLDTWRGQRVLLKVRGDSTDLPSTDEWIVVEVMEDPRSTVHLLCEVLGRIPQLLDDVSGPLLFVGNVYDDLPARYAALTDPWQVSHDCDDDGQLTLLALGSAIAGNPVLADFFDALRPHDVDAPVFVDLLAATLGGVTA